MIQKSTLKFLKDLKLNNNKSWFDNNRKSYESAKEDYAALIGNIISGIAAFDETVSHLTVKDCVFRINKDIRFSKDKTPYKTNFGGSISKGGKKINAAGYYLHLEPGKSFAGGGFYMPMPPELAKIRQEIDYNFKEWNTLLANKAFKKNFPNGIDGIDTLVRPPKGYDENNPAIEFLKMKGFIVTRPFTDQEVMSPAFLKDTLKTFEAMKPLIQFLNHAIE